TNFKGLPDWEGLFAMGGFCPLNPMFSHQSEHQARPLDRALSYSPRLAFSCRKRAKKPAIPSFL
ncbi:hypothetical protein, partial [Aeromonas sobria]|uniref:hypothetical protein n=1 Tax=Aeromonas sobria TaxID=646 RepID=UPI00195B44A0